MSSNINKNNEKDLNFIDSSTINKICNSQENLENKNNEKKENIINDSFMGRSKLVRWFNDVFMSKMDRYAFARAITVFTLTAFFLGNNLQIFLWIFLSVTIYLLLYRVVRFWVKRWLLYLIEFCYFGNILIIYYILFDGISEDIFAITYICNSGIMTLAIIIFNNQAEFTNTDRLTSSWVHALPFITNWAIRWRHRIYSEEIVKSLNFHFIYFGDYKFQINDLFYKFLYLPFLFWIFWALTYAFLMKVVLRYYSTSPKYWSGLTDFKSLMKGSKIFGDLDSNTMIKYLLQHFFLFVCSLPLAILCFYFYAFNCLYIIFIIVYLGWNTGRNMMRHMEKTLNKKKELLKEEK